MKNVIDVNVGKKLRQRRLELGLSQQKLAAKLNVTFQQLQKYEMGTNRLSASRLFVAADALAVSPGFFFDPFEVEGPEQEIPDFVAMIEGDAQLLSLNEAFRNIREVALKRTILQLIEKIADSQI